MPDSPPPSPPEPPSLLALFLCFQSAGLQSFGGGLTAWIRQEIVVRRGWLSEPAFLSGLAMSQIAPGANAVNLSIFIGTTLRGAPGAVASFAGVMALPLLIVLVAGALYAGGSGLGVVGTALGGAGAAAIGMVFATGGRMVKRGIRGKFQALLAILLAISVGLLHVPLWVALLVGIPASLLALKLDGGIAPKPLTDAGPQNSGAANR